MAVEGYANRCLRFSGKFDRCNGVDAKTCFRAKPATDMVGDDADLVTVELVSLRDQLHQMKYRLRRNMQGQAAGIEAGHRGMRLEAGMGLARGAEDALDEQRIIGFDGCGDRAAHGLRLLRKSGSRTSHILSP